MFDVVHLVFMEFIHNICDLYALSTRSLEYIVDLSNCVAPDKFICYNFLLVLIWFENYTICPLHL